MTGSFAPRRDQTTHQCRFLNAIFHNCYRQAPDQLTAWQSANHLERDPKRKKDEDDATTPAPPTTPPQ